MVTIKQLIPELCSENYHKWLNDPSINKYLESRFVTHSYESVREYVAQTQQNKKEILFGIFNKDSIHIGNIKLGNIDYFHGFGEIGLLIGERELSEKGMGTRAIELVTSYAFSELNLRKVMAGIYSNNYASIRAFEKNDFIKVGVFKDHRICDEGIVDQYQYEKIK